MMKSLIKKYRDQIILILTIVLIIFISTRFTNVFGSNTDWLNQHTIIPEYFRQTFYQTGSLIKNLALNYGAGENIFNFSYYGLLSPIILPSYLFPNLSMTTYITIVNIIILFASSLLFYHFLKRHNYNSFISLTTSLIFTLASPLIFHMHRHIMFVNYMPFLIMSLMGVDIHLEKKRNTLLIISIFLMIMTSYYYSVCGLIVVAIYYLYSYLTINKQVKAKVFMKDAIKFIAVLIIPILLSAVLLVPTMYTLLQGRGSSEAAYSIKSLLTPNLKIHKTFCGTYGIGISMIGFIALLYLIFTKKKSNVITASIISIILFIPLFRYLLNGGLYLREKCFIPFLPLLSYFFAYLLKELFLNHINIKKFIIFLFVIAIIILPFNIKEYCYLVLILFIILVYLYNKFKIKYLVTVPIVLLSLITCITEALKEDNVTIEQYKQIFNTQTETTLKEILQSDNSFYRSNNLDYPTKTVNKVYFDNYYTTNLYSSTYNKDYLNFIRNSFINSVADYNYFLFSANKNILFNSYMGVKYLYSSTELGLGYTKIADNLYQNELARPIIYSTSNTTNNLTYSKYSYPYNLEVLFQSVITEDESNTEITNAIKEYPLEYTIISNEGVEITSNTEGFTITVENSGTIQLKLSTPIKNKLLFINLYGLKENSCSIGDSIEMTINNVSNILTCRTWIYKNKNDTFHYLINDPIIDTLNIELKRGTYNITNIEAYILDYDELLTYNTKIEAMDITSIKNDTITGTININEDGYLVTSIPYDKGFTIKIDDEVIETLKVNEAFLGAKLEKGVHKVTITYKSPGLDIGIIISIMGIIFFIINLIYERTNMNKIKSLYLKYKEIINYLIFGILTTVVSLGSYYILVLTVLDATNPLQLQIANIIAWITCVTFAYITNKLYVFKPTNKLLYKEIIEFYCSRLVSLFIDMGLMYVLVSTLNFNDKIVKIIIQIIIIIVNYLISKLFVFKKEKK